MAAPVLIPQDVTPVGGAERVANEAKRIAILKCRHTKPMFTHGTGCTHTVINGRVIEKPISGVCSSYCVTRFKQPPRAVTNPIYPGLVHTVVMTCGLLFIFICVTLTVALTVSFFTCQCQDVGYPGDVPN